MTTILGIDAFCRDLPRHIGTARLGLLCNQSSVNGAFKHSRDLIAGRLPGQLSCLLSPQHGFYSEKQDNMIESAHHRDDVLDIPVFSLYGDTRKPTVEMCSHFDILLVDLLDVGTRVYTFMSTLAYCLEAAAEFGKKIIVLDRPNPLGGTITEGNITQDDCRSFVGLFPMPMRHGLTFGELGRFMNSQLDKPADLEVVPMQGWKRGMLYDQTGLPWIYPSPNLPTFHSALVYPGQVVWEGTNISEGRGTTLPFELFGAPFIDPRMVLERLSDAVLAGCQLRPLAFEPTANKWQGQVCRGFQIHVLDPQTFRPYRLSLALMQAIADAYPDFAFKQPPYEYEYERLPIDLILGSADLRKRLFAGEDILALEESWQDELRDFDRQRKECFLYPER